MGRKRGDMNGGKKDKLKGTEKGRKERVTRRWRAEKDEK